MSFKQFKRILEHFFIQTAATFFRKDGTEAEEFFAREADLKRQHGLADRRRRQIAPQRQNLATALRKFHDALASGAMRRETDEILTPTLDALSGDRPLTANGLRTLAREARGRIEAIDARARVARPRGVGLTRELSHAWARYEVERKRLVEEPFSPAYRRLEEAVRDAAGRADIVVDLREDTAERLGDRISKADKVLRSRARQVRNEVGAATQKVSELASNSLREFEARATATLVEFERLDFAGMSEEDFLAVRARLEGKLEANAAEHAQQLDLLVDQVARLGVPGAAVEDTLEALETELEDRRSARPRACASRRWGRPSAWCTTSFRR